MLKPGLTKQDIDRLSRDLSVENKSVTAQKSFRLL